MTTDDFTEAARAEAERRHFPLFGRPPVISAVAVQGFQDGASWAHDHLAAQEPTDTEVEAAARSIYEYFPRKYMDEFGFTCTAHWEDLEPHMQDEYRVVARAALSAARAARRDEEKR